MRKILIVFTILILLISLSACGLNAISIPPIPTATPYIAPTVVPTATPEPEIIAAGLEHTIIINIQDNRPDDYMDPIYGTSPILTFRYQTPIVYIEGLDSSSEQINACLKSLDSKYFSSDGESGTEMDKYTELATLATDNYSEENPIEFKFSRMANIERADDSLICIKFTNTTYTFGNESEEVEYHYFDTVSGLELEENIALSESYPEAEKNEAGLLEITNENSSGKEIIDLVTVDNSENDLYLDCSGIIYDLHIGDEWYCNVLNNSAVQLRAKLPDGFPELMISYSSGGKDFNMLLSKDGETGSAILINYSDIEVVG